MLPSERKENLSSDETAAAEAARQILLVEDDRGDARLVEAYLSASELHCRISTVTTLRDALARAETGRYDVVVADLGLPDSVGLETFHSIYDAVGRTVPIIVLSGSGDDATSTAAVAAGAQDYLPKGELSASVLSRTIRYAIERHRMHERMERVERLAGLGRLATKVAHEFNNVLMGVLPWAQVIARTDGNARVQEAVRHVVEAVERGKQITSQVLVYARAAEPKKVVFEARAWLRLLAVELKPTLRAAGDLLLILPVEDVFLSADRRQLAQAISNLVRNADEAGVEGRPIRLSVTRASRNGVQIVVADEGTGIPAQDREKIFEPLYSTKPNSTGLGLPIAFEIVRSHGGTIAAEPNQPRGSRVIVTLPAVEEVAASKPETEDRRSRSAAP